MKKILFLSGIIALLNNTGCLIREEGRHGHYHEHEHYERHEEVIVAPPTVIVRPPVVIVR